jgi:hypothetical protein
VTERNTCVTIFPDFLVSLKTIEKGHDCGRFVLATIRAGGDSAGRTATLGSWLGAHLAIQAIPREWRNRLTAAARINAALDKILLDLRW